jgi:cytochrome-b5 reductase
LHLLVAAVVVGVSALVLAKLSKRGPPTFLNGEKQRCRLVKRVEVSHDTRLFRFALPTPEHRLGLPVGKHMYVYATVGGESVSRAYTPVSSDDDLGHFDLLIKVYFRNTHPRFPDGGKMSQHLESLKLGDEIEVKGPIGKITYLGHRKLALQARPREEPDVLNAAKIGMIAGGTGITPMLQVIRAVLKEPVDHQPELWLLFANQTEQDILLRTELDDIARNHRNVHVWYTLDRPGADWKYSSGFINKDMVAQHLPAPAADSVILMCGPRPMIDNACLPNLRELKFTDEQLLCF